MLFKFIHSYILPQDDRAIGWLNSMGNDGWLVEVVHRYIQDYVTAALQDNIIGRIDAISILIELREFSIYKDCDNEAC